MAIASSSSQKRSLPFLPEEIIVNIVYRLPVKSVGRFRCVCKLWQHLLSQPQFIRTHLNHATTNKLPMSLILKVREHENAFYSAKLTQCPTTKSEFTLSVELEHLSFFSVTEEDMDHSLFVCGSCDGLILVHDNPERTGNYCYYYQDGISRYWVMNPAIQDFKRLVDFPCVSYAKESYAGFGYDPVGYDYKIVILSYEKYMEQFADTIVSIYSLKNDTWKSLGNFRFCPYFCTDSGLLVNGYLHWLVFRYMDSRNVILAFDLAQEKFIDVPTPTLFEEYKSSYGDCYCLGCIGDCLCLYSQDRWYLSMDVWVMKEYGVQSSWTKFTIVNHDKLRIMGMFLIGQGEFILVKQVGDDDCKLVIYNSADGTSKDIVDSLHTLQSLYDSWRYTESLVSIRSF